MTFCILYINNLLYCISYVKRLVKPETENSFKNKIEVLRKVLEN